MVLDCHLHIVDGPVQQQRLLKSLNSIGMDGAAMFSLPPESMVTFKGPKAAADRLDNLFKWTSGVETFFPFFWIDPTEEDALQQVQMAVQRGVVGFKCICNHFYPGDAKAIDVFRAIAKSGRPIMFHSGILWDGTASSKYCRPSEFEAMLDVPQLRFALAHVSWPWTDECIAVYGKFLAAFRARPELSCEMFIDITRGTPAIYRKNVLETMFTIGYKIEDNVMFGTDGRSSTDFADGYQEHVTTDNAILESVGLSRQAREKVFSQNLLQRFIWKKS